MKKRWRVVLLIALTAVFLFSVGMVLRDLVESRRGAETYREAKETAAPSGETSGALPAGADAEAARLCALDLGALQAVNSEVLGWLQIPDTAISYPLVQHSDNRFYLRRTWKGESGVVGSIFLEWQNAADFSDFNTFIYGHNMRVGSMFGTLRKFEDADYCAAHPYVYIVTPEGCRKYEVFAAQEVTVRSDAYRIGLTTAAEKQAYLDARVAASAVNTGVAPSPEANIITLSTCATSSLSSRRFVVQATLIGVFGPDGLPIEAEAADGTQPAGAEDGPAA